LRRPQCSSSSTPAELGVARELDEPRPAACSDVGVPEGSAFSRRLELRQPGWVVVGTERSCHVWMAPANPVGIILAELQRPLPHRLMADPNPAGGEHPETEQKPKVQPHDMADDLGWEPMTGVARMARRFHPSPMPRPGHPWLMRRSLGTCTRTLSAAATGTGHRGCCKCIPPQGPGADRGRPRSGRPD
jgi:hypothetical protein